VLPRTLGRIDGLAVNCSPPGGLRAQPRDARGSMELVAGRHCAYEDSPLQAALDAEIAKVRSAFEAENPATRCGEP
jgi:hypothetical protein